MLRHLAVLVLWTLVAASFSFGQDRAADTSLAQTKPGNCEMNAALLDSVRKEALEETNRDGAIILIARLGNGETSRMHSRRRLLIAKDYLIKYGLPRQRIVAAEGERVDGYGRVELYVAGKLRLVLSANRNKPMCVECCDPDEADFYPYRTSKKQRR